MEKYKVLSVVALLCMTIGMARAAGERALTLEEIVGDTFRPEEVAEIRSLPDGEYFTSTDARRTMIIRYAYQTGKAVDTLFHVGRTRQCDFESFDDYLISPTGHRIIILRKTEQGYRHSRRFLCYDYDVRRNLIKPLSETGRKVTNKPLFSPDGRMCIYVIDNNIYIKKFDFDSELQVTHDGKTDNIINGATDWVYEEEFGTTALMAWSPGSEHFAFVRTDETNVPIYTMQVYGESAYPYFHSYKYPKSGEVNSRVSLHIYDVRTRNIRPLDLPIDSESYIPRIEFTLSDGHLAVFTLNRHQNVFSLFSADPKSGVFRLVLRETNDAYIDPDHLFSLQFTPHGFIRLSEQDGYTHVYQHSPTGVLQRQVTCGSWDVTILHGMDPFTGTIYYESAEDSPLRRALFSVNTKGNKRRLTPRQGTNQALFSANFAYFVNTFSAVNIPPRISLHEARNGKELRLLQDNASLARKLKDIPQRTFTTIETADGLSLNAWILQPVNFDAARQYPLLFTQYSGPGSQKVLDRYESPNWETYLAATQGFIVACVDGRGTGARGQAFRKSGYLRLGQQEAQDQADAARFLAQLSCVDNRRIAIWGWSFGGYTTLMAMTFGKGIFKTGIAVAPPTDWRFYDSAYTERYMRTPQENPDGYQATSPLLNADKLQGNLLLIHGTADDNVHLSQTLTYADALSNASKQFRFHLYKDRTHSLAGFPSLPQKLPSVRLHLYTLMTDFLLGNN
ncbi:MAG: S9 family peptidase [Tannerellaceae bacterium]|jgi:dipeptidyl-peptidase-4|nr:S9 family peptidase [Tannerellaceae bacterium]